LQEFPTRFVYDHGKDLEVKVAFKRRTCETLWWLQLEVRHYEHRKSRVYTFGGGWKEFVLDNGISVGDLLVFELVGFSRFLVHLFPPDASVVPYQYTRAFCGKTGGFCRSGEEEPVLLNSDEEDMSSPSSPPSSPSDKMPFVPCFRKILCPAHLRRLVRNSNTLSFAYYISFFIANQDNVVSTVCAYLGVKRLSIYIDLRPRWILHGEHLQNLPCS